MSEIQKIVAGNIRYFLKQKHISQTTLGKLTGVGTGSITIALKGNAPNGITVETLAAIAQVLEVTPGDLVDDWRQDTPSNTSDY